MIKVCRYARENMIPYLGICLGMQVAVIEFCRNVLGVTTAHSKEFVETKEDVITTMDDTDYANLGGTLRLGAKTTLIRDKSSLAYKVYGKEKISERHRHRYEVNPNFVERMESKGLIFSGKDSDSNRMEICEIRTHPFFFATQFHPEFKTNPFNPVPCFSAFVLCASKQYDKFKMYGEKRYLGIYEIENTNDSTPITSDSEDFSNMIKFILENNTKISHLVEIKEDNI